MRILSAEGVRKQWDSTLALDGIDLQLHRGEVRGLLGPNGAGKTTLLRVLFGLVAPDSGSVEVFGRRLFEPDSQVLLGVAGFVESPSFYPYLSARTNLELLAALDDPCAADRIDEALELVDLTAHARERAGGYSTGMRQRLGIAAALLRRPALLLLDEPTNGLDPAGARAIRALLVRASEQGVAVLLSSHDIATVEDVCDSFTILRSGRVAWDGSAASLRAAAPEAAHRLQTRDDGAAMEFAQGRPGVRVAPADGDGGGIIVAASDDGLEEYTCALGRAGIGVRRLELLRSPLESMFFALTEGPEEAVVARGDAMPVPVAPPPVTASAPAPARAGASARAAPETPAGIPAPTPVEGAERRAGSVYRVELRKLVSQTAVRIVALACVLGPFAFAGVLALQTSTPSDTLFGRWVHTSGFALPLVVLSFAGGYGLPILTGVLTGDIFSAEDRYDTWKTLLTRSCGRSAVFAGKVLAAATVSAGALAALAISSLAAGLVATGHEALIGLSGTLISPGRCVLLVLVSWLFCLLPTLAFTSFAIVCSLRSRSGIVGVLAPGVLALVMQLLLLVGTGTIVQGLLVASAFDAWHGLFTAHLYYGPLIRGAIVSVTWITVCLGLAWFSIHDRACAGASSTSQAGWIAPLRAVAASAAVIAVLAIASNWGPTGVTATRLDNAIATTFNNLTIIQQSLLGHDLPPGAQLNILPTCTRRGVPSRGPGDDWLCHIDIYALQPGASPYREAAITYDVSVKANGCYHAEAPPAFVGQQTMRAANGATVINPLFAFDGCFDVL